MGYPFRFSTHTTNPDAGVELLKDFIGGADRSILAVKTISLISVLNPLFEAGLVDNSGVENIRVVLDDNPWENPIKEIERTLSETEGAPSNTEFSTGDSEAVPGLQIADIAAYSWARHKRKGGYGEVIDQIDQYRFTKQ